MTDRRRTPRYVLDAPLRGEALPMEDVTIESYSPDRLVVVSPSAPRSNEELMIHLTTACGLESRRAAVVFSAPVSVSGALCYRVELHLNDVLERREDGSDGREDAADGRGESQRGKHFESR